LKTQSKGKVITLLTENIGVGRWWMVTAMVWLLYSCEWNPVPIVQETGWALGPVWTCTDKLVLTEVWTLDCPARSGSLYYLGKKYCTSFKAAVACI